MHENAYFIVKGIYGNLSINDVKNELNSIHGIESVSVDSATNLMAVDYNSSGTSYDRIENCVNKMGYQIAADASVIHTR